MSSKVTIRIPKLKPFIDICVMNGKVYFFKKPGMAIVIDDHCGYVSTVCNLMSKGLTIEVMKFQLAQTHPNSAEFLDDLLITLDQEYLLEDMKLSGSETLSEYDVIRWSRNIEFFGAYTQANCSKFNHQETLKNLKITVLGLGGVGSHVLYNLVAMGIHNFKILDYDRIELSNLNRQVLYTEADVGKLKGDVARERILSFLPTANIEVINHQIASVADIKSVITGQDFVISAIDSPRDCILDWVNEACVSSDVPFICGALDSGTAVYYTVIPHKTGCIECWKSTAKKSGILFQDVMNDAGFVKAQSPNITIMPFISILSGMIANEVLKIITCIAPPQSLARMCAYDFATGMIEFPESWEIVEDCLICQANRSP